MTNEEKWREEIVPAYEISIKTPVEVWKKREGTAIPKWVKEVDSDHESFISTYALGFHRGYIAARKAAQVEIDERDELIREALNIMCVPSDIEMDNWYEKVKKLVGEK